MEKWIAATLLISGLVLEIKELCILMDLKTGSQIKNAKGVLITEEITNSKWFDWETYHLSFLFSCYPWTDHWDVGLKFKESIERGLMMVPVDECYSFVQNHCLFLLLWCILNVGHFQWVLKGPWSFQCSGSIPSGGKSKETSSIWIHEAKNIQNRQIIDMSHLEKILKKSKPAKIFILKLKALKTQSFLSFWLCFDSAWQPRL